MARSAAARFLPVPVIRLLLVEDGQSDAFFVENLLDEVGGTRYETRLARTQSEAIALLEDQEFDVCLLDLRLPGTNDFSALIDIQERVPALPVLILTGVNDTTLAKRAVGRGAQDYLLKDDLEKHNLSRSIDHAIERKRMEKVLFMRANHDALTGLANRSMFERNLSMALARAGRGDALVAVLFLDLDHFKTINDTYGHEAGDEILKSVATRLKCALRSYDTAARLGGDEFAILLDGITSPRNAATIAEKIVRELTPPVLFHGTNLEIGVSIGIALSARGSRDGQPLLQQADTAMYHAKREAGNACRFYAPEMQDMMRTRLKLEEEIRHAVTAGELQIFYQPYLTANGDAIAGVEALLRWASPERGLVLPGAFLSVAETMQLMPDIGRWTAEQLRRDIALWRRLALPPLEIALNLSACQLDEPGFIESLSALADKECLGEHHLAIEISEMDVNDLSAARMETLRKASALGIALHMDHFGRGSLSLQTLNALPFSLLKIDLSLIQAMHDEKAGDSLVRAAILLAHHFGIKAGATGVETPLQLQTAVTRKCDSVQGFLTARPMTASDIVAWLHNRYSAAKQ